MILNFYLKKSSNKVENSNYKSISILMISKLARWDFY